MADTEHWPEPVGLERVESEGAVNCIDPDPKIYLEYLGMDSLHPD